MRQVFFAFAAFALALCGPPLAGPIANDTTLQTVLAAVFPASALSLIHI